MEKYRPRDDSMFNPDIQVNDVCLLRKSQAKRAFWKLCTVEQLVLGRDGSVRSAKVSVLTNGSKNQFVRSVKHLIPSDISPTEQQAPNVATSPTEPQAPNIEAQAQNIETPVPQQMFGRAKHNATVVGELACKYGY